MCILGPLFTFGVAAVLFMVAGVTVKYILGPFSDWLDGLDE
jgi:hypothetical protein